MFKNLISITAGITISLAALGTTATAEPTLKEQIIAIDKELAVMRKDTLTDPAVKAAQAELQAAVVKLKATEDEALVRTSPKGKEMVEKFRKLLAQYQAEQKAEAAKQNPKK
ncbi:MAG: hypothetical protein WCS70_01950 [Verrucomicrobiota bacterium]